MSKFSGTGLSINASIPLAQGISMVGNYADEISSYTHTISANGGFISASFVINGNNNFAENWLQYGIGRHIQVFGPSMQIIWEGFVNQIDISMGGASFSIGPLVNVCNYAWGMYTPIIYDPNTGEPISYTPMPTYAVRDNDSIAKYGLWEKLINIGEATPDDARYIRDLYLEENKIPEGNPSLSITDSPGELNINISCRGYIDWLNYIYNNPDESHVSVYLSTIIKDILGDDPNTIISTAYDRIDENLYITDPYSSSNKTAKTLIDDMTAFGGGNDDRWTFGIYANRKPVYAAIPTTVEYLYHKTDRVQEIENVNGQVVKPWDVVPCKWVGIPDFLSSFAIKITSPQNDPRVFFGEEITFTAPDQVTISGSKVRRLAQYLAKLGLGGV